MSDQTTTTLEGQSDHLVGELSRLKSQLAAERKLADQMATILRDLAYYNDLPSEAKAPTKLALAAYESNRACEKFPEENP